MRNIGISLVGNLCLELRENFSKVAVWDDSHFFDTSLSSGLPFDPSLSYRSLLTIPGLLLVPPPPGNLLQRRPEPPSSDIPDSLRLLIVFPASTLAECDLAVDNAAPGIRPRPTPLHFVWPHLSMKIQRGTSGTDLPNSQYRNCCSGGDSSCSCETTVWP